ncbi:MAG TPA: hypothetical protein ENL20_08220 [Candidatus Cloacimonetes bacterium]|nr:hypothetical protein [Candidatus Cloacimonadota bacterium]
MKKSITHWFLPRTKIHKTDGKIETKYFTLEEGSILLEPDVRKYFPDSESVNNALRSLQNILPANIKHG